MSAAAASSSRSSVKKPWYDADLDLIRKNDKITAVMMDEYEIPPISNDLIFGVEGELKESWKILKGVKTTFSKEDQETERYVGVLKPFLDHIELAKDWATLLLFSLQMHNGETWNTHEAQMIWIIAVNTSQITLEAIREFESVVLPLQDDPDSFDIPDDDRTPDIQLFNEFYACIESDLLLQKDLPDVFSFVWKNKATG